MTLQEILETSVKHNASDIHLTVGVPPILRIHKELVRLGTENLTHEETQ